MTNQLTLASLESIMKNETVPFQERCVLERIVIKAAFEEVSPDNWKDPVNAVVNMDVCNFSERVICYAILCMTGTKATAFPQCPSRGGQTMVRFVADGYRAGECGDK